MENFTKADIEQALRFGDLLTKYAKFDVSVPDLINVSRALVWFNSLPKKIEANVLELVSVKKAEEPTVGKVKK
jgi:hypothetical protein